MTRAEVSFAFSSFFDRAVCATVADANLARAYVAALQAYIQDLEGKYQAIDQWSVLELERAREFLCGDERWVLGATEALSQMAQARQLLEKHIAFLRDHGLLPEYLAA
jgi:hypothetical protein